MRFAFVHSAYSRTLPSGENSVVEAQAKLLRTRGHEVLLIQAETDELSLKPLYKLRSMIQVAFGVGKSPFTDLIKFNPDFILVHNLFPNFGSTWMRKLKKKHKHVKILAVIHNFRYVCASGNLLRNGIHCEKCVKGSPINALIYRCYRNSFFYTVPWFVSRMLRVSKRNIFDNVDASIVLSAATVNQLKKIKNFKFNYLLLPNFVPSDKTFDSDASATTKNGKWVVVARLSVEKGITRLVQRWPSELKLDIFGDGPEFSRIQELIKAQPNITLKGLISSTDLEQILPRYLGAIHCSIWLEIAPLTVLEYHRAGLPVIYTGMNFTPFADDIELVGVRLETYDTLHLKQACTIILQNYRDASIKSHQAYLLYYSEDAWMLRFENLLRKVQSL